MGVEAWLLIQLYQYRCTPCCFHDNMVYNYTMGFGRTPVVLYYIALPNVN